MSATSATAHAHVEPAGHHELGFVRTYMFSTDHKMIARQFLFLGLSMMIIGGLLALVVRWELAWPETPVPGLGMILTETGVSITGGNSSVEEFVSSPSRAGSNTP